MKNTLYFILSLFICGGMSAQETNRPQKQYVTLESEHRENSIDPLQATLYELIDQRHAVQQCHWNVEGPLFYSLHDMLGHFYEDLDAIIDVVAERQLVLGSAADGRPAMAGENTDLPEVPAGKIDGMEAVNLLVKRTKMISNALYKRIETTGAHDPVSQDLLIDVAAMIDMQLWKLRSFQQ